MAGSSAPEEPHPALPEEGRGVRDLASLLAAASAINGALEPEDALARILAAGGELLGARRMALVLEDDAVPDVPQVLVRGSWSDVGGPPDRATSIVGHVRRTRTSALGTLGVAEAPILGRASAGTAIAAPVEHRGELLGAIVVEAAPHGHFRDTQRVALELLALYAAVVLARWRSVVAEREQVAALLEADRMRREFAVIAGHELRTPVTVIRAAAASARREGMTVDARAELLDTIEQQATRFEQMAGDIAAEWRRVARIRIARYEIDLADVVATVAVEASERGWSVRAAEERPCPVWANRAVVRRVLGVLIDGIRDPGDGTVAELSIERDARYAVVVLRLPAGSRARWPDREVHDGRALIEAGRGTVEHDGRTVRIALPRARGTAGSRRFDLGTGASALVDAVPAPGRATAPPPTPVAPSDG